jgi:hypothetical protein
MSRADPPQTVDIHLRIAQSGEDVQVDFAFDLSKDNLTAVMRELVETLELSKDVEDEVRKSMLDQMAKAGVILPDQAPIARVVSPPRSAGGPGLPEDAPEDLETDAQFTALLEKHKRELAAMDARHLEEQQRLLARLSEQTPKQDDDLLIF